MRALKKDILEDRSQDGEIIHIQCCDVIILGSMEEGRGYLTSRSKESNLIEFKMCTKCTRMKIFSKCRQSEGKQAFSCQFSV